MSKRRHRLANAVLDKQRSGICGHCDGKGRVEQFVKPDRHWPRTGFWRTVTCPRCDGRGRK